MTTAEDVKENGTRRTDMERFPRAEIWQWGEYLYLIKNEEIKAELLEISTPKIDIQVEQY